MSGSASVTRGPQWVTAPPIRKASVMDNEADVCLIVEGGYPYLLGGVASWMDALIRASPTLKFHVISITISSQSRVRKFVLPDNVCGLTDVILDECPQGRRPTRKDAPLIEQAV